VAGCCEHESVKGGDFLMSRTIISYKKKIILGIKLYLVVEALGTENRSNVRLFCLQNEEGCNCFAVLDSIVPHLYDLSQITPQNTGQCVAEVLKEKQQDFRAHCNSFPGLDTVCLRVTDHVHTNIYTFPVKHYFSYIRTYKWNSGYYI
jgi:hypothetical protein